MRYAEHLFICGNPAGAVAELEQVRHHDNTGQANILFAAIEFDQGRAESAKAAISMALDQNAHQTMAVVERGCLPYRDRSISRRLCGLIRAAGLPEA